MRYEPTDQPVMTFTTGPVESYHEVMHGLGSRIVYDFDMSFLKTYERVSEKLRPLVKSETMPVILHGEAVLGLESAAVSLIGSDDVVLNLVSGVYAKAYEPWLARNGAEIIEIRVPYDDIIDPAAVAKALRDRPDITVVVICHHDTPCGTINPIEEIGRIVAEHGAFYVVDAASSFGAMQADAESCKADVFLTGPHKVLGCPPALSIVGVSERAWAKMEANLLAPRGSILSILDWRDAWRSDRLFPFSPSVAEINGLDAAIDRHNREGNERVHARHALTAKACREGVKAMGLKLWPLDEKFAAPTVTAVRIPEGVDDARVRQEIRLRYGLLISPGRSETMGKLWRIGHMGIVAQPINMLAAVVALGHTLNAHGYRCDVAAGAAAVMATIDAD